MPFSYRDRLPICNYAGVYSIACVVTGKVYVGSALVVRARLHAHRSELRRGVHSNQYLQRAWDKYGEDKFRFAVLQGLGDQTEILIEREQFWIDKLGAAVESTGYNMNPIAGASPMQGRTHSEESRRKISEAQKGRDLKYLTEAAAKTNKGRKRSEDERKKISDGTKGKPKTEAHKVKIKAAHWSKGPNASEIAKKSADKNRGRKLSDQHRTRIAEAGRRRWEAHRAGQQSS